MEAIKTINQSAQSVCEKPALNARVQTAEKTRGMFKSLTLALSASLIGLVMGLPNDAFAGDICGAQVAVTNAKAAVSATGSYLPRLDANVDKCFNPARPQYSQQTHQILASLNSQYTQALSQLTQSQTDIAGNQLKRFASDAGQVVVNLNQVNKTVLDQASNLKNYGFTTSDSMSGGQYRYPQCNSQTNDNPAGVFSGFYSNLLALRQAVANLQTAVNCAQRAN